jgi:hypothetical protein
MGFTPNTGNEISIACVYQAFGLTPSPGSNIGLNSTLGVNRQPPQASGVTAISAGAVTTLSSDMGGLDTPQNYCCTLTFWASGSNSAGYSTSTAACQAVGAYPVTAYFTGSCPTNWSTAVTNSKIIYLESDYSPAFTTASGWYKTVSGANTGQVFQVNGSGVPINLTNC